MQTALLVCFRLLQYWQASGTSFGTLIALPFPLAFPSLHTTPAQVDSAAKYGAI
jgi:hypothetical protein